MLVFGHKLQNDWALQVSGIPKLLEIGVQMTRKYPKGAYMYGSRIGTLWGTYAHVDPNPKA